MYFFDRAFRSFFLGGSIFAFISMLVWWSSFSGFTQLSFSGVVSLYWHAHEMVFGYAVATVTGFLLTAVMNWTKLHSASGIRLLVLFLFWLSARLSYLINAPLEVTATLDLTFSIGLFLHFFIPVYRTKLWAQAALAIKFFLLIIANIVFYAGALGYLPSGLEWGVKAGLFLVLAINLTMMRRLIPFFTEKALGLPEQKQVIWIDIASLLGFLSLALCAILSPRSSVTAAVAFPLATLHVYRWLRWYRPKVWRVVLLWPLHISYAFMTIGMGLYGFVGLGLLPETLAIHALAAGGVGLLCSSIMARIALGHTNRNVFEPPKLVSMVFVILALTAFTRVFMPIIMPSLYSFWIQLSQWGWASAFLLLSILYWPILSKPSLKKDMGLNL